MQVYELSARYDRRKSFYGKAHVIELDDGTKQLQSYNTIVCQVDSNGNYKKLWDGNTQTTNRHIREFQRQLGII